MPDLLAALSPGSIPRAIAGGLLYWLPGLAWAWALARELGWTRWLPISIVLAFTVQPLAMLVANVVLGLEVTLGTTALMCVATTLAGLAVGVRSHVHASLQA